MSLMIVKPSIAQSVERWTVVKQVCNLLVAGSNAARRIEVFFFLTNTLLTNNSHEMKCSFTCVKPSIAQLVERWTVVK